jgi:hypothetical protein
MSLPPLPDHHPDCRPKEGWCHDDCERYDAIMADAMWRDRRPPTEPIAIVHYDPDNGQRSMEMLGVVMIACFAAFVWLWIGVAIGWWWFG